MESHLFIINWKIIFILLKKLNYYLYRKVGNNYKLQFIQIKERNPNY